MQTEIIAAVRTHEAARRLGAVLPWHPTEAAIEAACDALDHTQKRARARTQSHGDLRAAVEVYQEAMALCHAHGWDPIGLHVTRLGGGVPNGYQGQATTTAIHVDATRPVHVPGATVAIQTGPGGIRSDRVDADRRPYGRTLTYRVSVLVPEGTRERPDLRSTTPRLESGCLWWRW